MPDMSSFAMGFEQAQPMAMPMQPQHTFNGVPAAAMPYSTSPGNSRFFQAPPQQQFQQPQHFQQFQQFQQPQGQMPPMGVPYQGLPSFTSLSTGPQQQPKFEHMMAPQQVPQAQPMAVMNAPQPVAFAQFQY